MSVIERFTRDVVSKFVWAGLALAAAIGLAYSVSSGGQALDQERAVAEGRAVGYVEGVLAPRLESRDLGAPITGQPADSLEAVVRRSIMADERVSRVRIWSTEGTLLFSTDQSDRPGSKEGLNDPLLRHASREGPFTRSDFSDGGGPDDPERSLLRTYVPVGGAAVAEIDQTDAGTVAPLRTEWVYYRFLAGVSLLLFLVMTVISLRDPIERINVGVPFASSSVPSGFALIDDDRLAAVHEVYRLASERVGRLKEKLDESEEARRGLESYIQQQLSKAGSSAPRPAVPAASDAPAPAADAGPTIVQVPDSDVVVAPLPDDAWATSPAGPLARASRAQKPPPTTPRTEKPLAEKPRRSPKRPRVKPEKPAAAPPQVVEPQPVAEPEPAAEPERRVAAVAATRAAAFPSPATVRPAASMPAPARAPAPAPAQAPRKAPAKASAKVAAPARAPAPDPKPARTSRNSDVDDAKAHAAALETFIRLTESDRQHHDDVSTVDQGEIRAALARTAARKKPGGARLQPHDGPPEESLGGPPKRTE